MSTSARVDGTPPDTDPPGWPSWRLGGDLTQLEEEIRDKAAAGDLVDRGQGPCDLADMQTWGKDRAVRAAVLRYLLVGEEWPVEARGVRLRGIRIVGHLDLEEATLRCPLFLDCCYLDTDKPIGLDHATAAVIILTRCHLAGLDGELLIAKAVDLSRSVFTGPLKLASAEIRGYLDCDGARLEAYDEDHDSLWAPEMKVGGSVFLGDGFTSAGAIVLQAGRVGGQLNCRRARVTHANKDGEALLAEGIKVGESVFLGDGFTAAGAVRLAGADIGGELNCRGARLTRADKDGYALVADSIKVGERVFLDQGFTAAGAIRLAGAIIGSQLSFRGARLNRADKDGYALVADRIKVGESVLLDEGFTAVGAILLAGAHIKGNLESNGATLKGRNKKHNALVADRIKIAGSIFLTKPFTATGSIRLFGADIGGQLNCSGAQLARADKDGYALVADTLKASRGVFLDDGFTAAAAVRLVGADISGQLSCSGARLGGRDNHGDALIADGMKVAGNVFLNEGFTSLASAGAVRLAGARISGQLSCTGAHLNGRDKHHNALVADAVSVDQDVFLRRVVTTTGAVRIVGANISGQLGCSGARLYGCDKNGYALVADQIKVGGDVLLDECFAALGAVGLPGADIARALVCSSARLNGHDKDGVALKAGGMNVDSSIYLNKGFTASGTIWLRSARVRTSVYLEMERPATGVTGLDAAHTQVVGRLKWIPKDPVGGHVNLEGATVGELEDDWSGKRANGYWPTNGQLHLNGFTYAGFGGGRQAVVAQRLAWIRSQYPASATGRSTGFAAQPYQQLMTLYRQSGQDTEARTVAIARLADLRQHGDLVPYRKFGNWFLDRTIKFGYQTWRAGIGLAIVFAAFLIMSLFAQHHHAIVPVSDLVVAAHAAPVATQCIPSYPCFYPLGYTVDVVIPIINVHQADFWGLNGWGWVVGSWAATVLGWAAVTLLVVGYTGLVRQQ